MNISRRGIMTDGGVPCQLHSGLVVATGQQASFTGFKKMASRTAVQGECNLCAAAGVALGVFVDCSPKGDSATVETKGFEEVTNTGTLVVADLVTTGANGAVKKIAGATPTLAELTAGVWQVDEVVNATTVLIQIDARL